MSLCAPHWKQLQLEVTKASLERFTAKSEAEIVAKKGGMVQTIQIVNNRPPPATALSFDPLIDAAIAITVHARAVLGDLNGCPLCSITCDCGGADCAGDLNPKIWIEGAVEDQAEIAAHLGLLEVH